MKVSRTSPTISKAGFNSAVGSLVSTIVEIMAR
jgi:hypothetical protein